MEDYIIRVPQPSSDGSEEILIVIPRITHIFVYDNYFSPAANIHDEDAGQPSLLVNVGTKHNIRLIFEDTQERDVVYTLIMATINEYYSKG
ncbi:MAG: hypothetical protein KAS32_28100 [Candidatus Peribacteraceae bacterium]|nr:hypothetical protein [Candidatus Peribacteraceae bacterium]